MFANVIRFKNISTWSWKIKLALYEENSKFWSHYEVHKIRVKKIIIITMIEYKQVNKARLCNSKVFFFFFI